MFIFMYVQNFEFIAIVETKIETNVISNVRVRLTDHTLQVLDISYIYGITGRAHLTITLCISRKSCRLELFAV